MSRTIKHKYTKSKAFDKQCRNNGSCKWCIGNRMYKHLKKLLQYERTRTDNTE